MTRALRLLAMLLLAMPLVMSTLPASAQASASAPPMFRDQQEEQHFRALTSELRCVMCQNQSLADSNAMVAQQLRHEVLVLMRKGKSDDAIRDYLVARYGEFVLYKPRIEAATWLLWFGPAVLLLIGGVVVARVVRRHADDNIGLDDTQEW